MLGVSSAHPSLQSLVAFLLQLIVNIEHSAIYIIYYHQSTIESDAIAMALHSQLQTYKTYHNVAPAALFLTEIQRGTIFEDGALVISLVDEGQILKMIHTKLDKTLHAATVPYMHTKFILIVPDSERVKPRVGVNLNLLGVKLRNDGGLDFLVWPTVRIGQRFYLNMKRYSNVAELFSSIEWLKFSNRVNRSSLKGIQVGVLLKSTSNFNVEVVRHTSGTFYSGVFVGISRVLFDYFAVEEVDMEAFVYNEKSFYRPTNDVSRDVAFLDQRQTWPRKKRIFKYSLLNNWAIGIPSLRHWMPSMTDKYMVLAPHQLVPPEVTWTLFWQRTLLFGVIFGTTLGILVIRIFCRRIGPASPSDRLALLFDTFSRTLGLSAGNWLGRSSAERQLLVVLSFFAILLGSVFSGVLYEHSFPKEDKERFNTMQEICAAGLNTQIESAAFSSLFHIVGAVASLEYLSETIKSAIIARNCSQIHGIDMSNLKSDQAYVTSQYVGYRTDQHHILPEPFIKIPIPLHIEPFYQLRPVMIILRRCVEHGFILAFYSVASHSKDLELAKKYNEQDYALQQKRLAGEDTYFEFKLIVVGWTVASCVFIGELVSVASWPRRLFYWLRSKLRRAAGKIGPEM